MPKHLFERTMDYAAIDRMLEAGERPFMIAETLGYKPRSVQSYISRKKAREGKQRSGGYESSMLLNTLRFDRQPPLIRQAILSRKQKNLTVTRIAALSGYSETAVKSWLNGKRGFSFHAGLCLIKTMGYDLVLRDVDDKSRILDGSDLIDRSGKPGSGDRHTGS